MLIARGSTWLTLGNAAASIGAALVPLTLALGSGGCATTRAVPVEPLRPLRSATLDEVLQAHESFAQTLRSLSASGGLDLRDRRRGSARHFSVRVLAGRGGRLYLKASVAVVTALEAVSDGATFWFQVPSRKTVWTGDARRSAGSGDSGEPWDALRPSDVADALLPASLAPRAGETLLMDADRDAFSLAVGEAREGRGLVRRRAWLERETLRLSRWRTYDERGSVELEVSCADWRDGVPFRVTLARPAEGYEARFDFDKVQPNAALPDKAFQPRKAEGFKVVQVDAR